MARKGVLLILDGYGEGKKGEYNAVLNANSPYLKDLRTLQHSMLDTSGESVGLFAGEMGGSEVGHTTIGAGRVVPSTAKKIHDDILSHEFEKNKNLVKILKDLKKNNANIHYIGLLSDKNIHSDYNHLLELIRLSESKANHVYIHIITDGRDCGSYDSLQYLAKLKEYIKDKQNVEIASVSGRFYAMDREGNLDRTERAFNEMFNADNTIPSEELEKYIRASHKSGITDEYIEPKSIKTREKIVVNMDDYLFFYNFREDRLRQIVKMAEGLNCNLVTMSNVGGVHTTVLYPVVKTEHTLSEHLSRLGLSQIKISETTKYAHVTYFLNGGEERPFAREDRVHIATKKAKNFATTPKMRAKEIAKASVSAIKKNYDAVIVNFSNADMVGHTGDYKAAVKSIEYMDKCVKKICETAKKNGYFVLITADHGNAERMRTKDGLPHTSHTLNPVRCMIVDEVEHKMRAKGELKDVAPTFLSLMGVESNPYFEGKSLVTK